MNNRSTRNKEFVLLLVMFLLLLSFCGNVSAAEAFSIEYEGLQLEKSEQVEALTHPLLLSAPKRVNNSLRIEKQVQLQGTKQTYLYRVKPGYEIDQAADFYLDSLRSVGNLEFQCEQRNCGSSNDWANKIFGQSVLAGRDSNQEYFAGTIDLAGLHGWLSVYAVTNGRREPYLYITFIPVADNNVIKAVRDGVLLVEGRLQSDQVAPLYRYLDENPNARLMVLSFNKTPGENYDQNLKRSQDLAQTIAENLAEKLNVDSSKIQIKAMGNLGQKPLTQRGESWQYLYLIN